MAWHSMQVKEVFSKLKSSQKGLSSSEAKSRLNKYGPNQLKEEKKDTALQIFGRQFVSPLVIILIVATVISSLLGHVIDAAIIGVIIVLNAVFGFIQEFKAEKAMEALKNMAAPKASVLRDKKEVSIPAAELVPGDIIILNEGDRVPADARLIESANLEIDEASLTGESVPVAKEVGTVSEKTIISGRSNMLFASTIVTHGHGLAIVTDTGMDAEIGKIAQEVHEAGESITPLQKKLASVARFLGVSIIIICGIVFGIGILTGSGILDMFITSVALAVAAVPEGLPAVVTITLAIGLSTMAKRKAIIRKLPVAETLGSATLIDSDKTGTITKNEMTVKEMYVNKQIVEITGSGYAPEGEFRVGGKSVKAYEDEHTQLLLEISSICNLAGLRKEEEKWMITGDPTEAALIVAAAKAGLDQDALEKKYPDIAELSFDSKRKRMTTIHKHPKKANLKFAAVKGAPEVLLQYCTMIYENGNVRKITIKDKAVIKDAYEGMTNKALRVLAMAYRELPAKVSIYKPESIERELTFVGLVGMIDPPRPEVKDAIALCRKAGIKVVMITGDNRNTALAVAKDIGLFEPGKSEIITGEELDAMDDNEFRHIVNKIGIYARVSPEHKMRIIDAQKAVGHIVAMTGDGVNDAPALKKADIGVAMGLKGTDVAKEASDMVLEDDNFATIVAAVEEGRKIYDNIKKFIRYLLSCNIGEILTVFLAFMLAPVLWKPVLGVVVLPLLAVQLLWVNLLTDGLPALALGVDPADKGIMDKMPRDPKEKPVDKLMIIRMLLVGSTMAIGTLFLFNRAITKGMGIVMAQTIAFTAIVVFQLFNGHNSRSEDRSVFRGSMPGKWLLLAQASSVSLQLAVVYAPPLQTLFKTTALPLSELLIIVLVSASVLIVVEIQKAVLRLMAKRYE